MFMKQMEEKRRIKRHQLPKFLEVYNRVTDRPLGNIVNISPHGMMLVSKSQLMPHAVFSLRIKIPTEGKRFKNMDFEALSHWSRPDVTPGYFDTGFSFNKTTKEIDELTKALTEYFQFKFDDEDEIYENKNKKQS